MNVEGYARSNYFLVKPDLLEDFKEFADRINCDVVFGDAPNEVALISEGETGWTLTVYDKETDSDIDVELTVRLAAFLEPGSVAVLTEISREGMRSLRGCSCAVNSDGKVVSVSLDQVYDLAKVLGNSIDDSSK